jgi:hypothetical protein
MAKAAANDDVALFLKRLTHTRKDEIETIILETTVVPKLGATPQRSYSKI